MRHDRDPCLLEVIKRYGNASRLAEALGLSNQAVSAWKMIPAKHIRQISQASGLHPYRIRPDLYIEGFWNMGFNTAEIADKMALKEPVVDRYLQTVLARRRAGESDYDCSAIPAVSKPPVESE
jgi:DNA-binding transcriptional regulator YdaS (Cro superfamily)